MLIFDICLDKSNPSYMLRLYHSKRVIHGLEQALYKFAMYLSYAYSIENYPPPAL